MQSSTAKPPLNVITWLGYGGLIPFIGLTIAVSLTAAGDMGSVHTGAAHTGATYTDAAHLAVGHAVAPWHHALTAYGAAILSFVGALHWGFAMTLPELSPQRRQRAFIWSVIPALLAWVSLLLSPTLGALVLVCGFLTQYAEDKKLATASVLPGWYLPLRLRLTVIACVCLALSAIADRSLIPTALGADTNTPAPAAYRTGDASADGIGKFYDGREIAQVMGFDGAPWLDRTTRESEERTDWLVAELHLTPGMTVADIGAGSGYLSRRMAPLVRPGKVFAVDVQPQMVALLEQLSKQPNMDNIVPRPGAVDDVALPEASVDLALMVDVYHELAYPYEVMRSVVRALKPGGRMVFVEYRGEDPALPIKALHKMRESQVRREMAPFPLVWERTSERLPLQHVIVFRKAAH